MKYLLSLPAMMLAAALLQADTPGLVVDPVKKSVSIEAKVAPRKLAKYDQIYPIEVIACWPDPKGKKAHETVVTIDVKPSDVHKALEGLGLKPGKPARGDKAEAAGPEVKVMLEIPDGGGTKKLSIHRFLLDPKTKQPFPKDVKFRFTGSVMSKPDPTKPDETYGADLTGTLIAVYPVTDETVCQTSLTMKDSEYIKLEVDPTLLPKEGTPVKIIIEAIAAK
ncbi:YdjY domain-containing protein [Zavarzinella formosa]|uniref:YdjY domain-containing protein n=1 Tax=Zavarzinella formosa TaxID=360055 RepID=UPI0002EFD398|nr:YdjY domain-containing protein [Zavarzinella formosa]